MDEGMMEVEHLPRKEREGTYSHGLRLRVSVVRAVNSAHYSLLPEVEVLTHETFFVIVLCFVWVLLQ